MYVCVFTRIFGKIMETGKPYSLGTSTGRRNKFLNLHDNYDCDNLSLLIFIKCITMKDSFNLIII